MKEKYLWYTDTHFDKVMPWTLLRFLRHVRKENPKGIFLTGDISNGFMTTLHLRMLARVAKCPIYFVLGNHDYHFSSIKKRHQQMRELCRKFPNLIWMTESDVVALTPEVAVIGTEGWYDAQLGNPKYLKMTLDWMLTENFRSLPDMEARIAKFRELAEQSCQILADKLEKALEQDFKTIYILTHFPPWKEATRDEGTLLEEYYLPYNVNLRLGQTIEKIMAERKKRHVIVLAGHTHTDCWIHVAHNIECKVNQAKYYDSVRNEEHIFI